MSGQEGSLAGDPQGASVHPVGGMCWCESALVCVWLPGVLYWTLQHFDECPASVTASLGFGMKGRLQKMEIDPISCVLKLVDHWVYLF